MTVVQQLKNNDAVLRDKNGSTDEPQTDEVVTRGNVALSKFIDELSFDLENPKIIEESAESEELEEKSVHENVKPPAEIVVDEPKPDYTSRKTSNFVTVIEVKENDSFPPKPAQTPTNNMSSSFKSFRSDYENIVTDKSQLRNSVPIISEKPLIPPSLPTAKKKTPPK